MGDRTPTTEEVLTTYIDGINPAAMSLGEAEETFDRWLAEEIRKAKETAWDEGHSWGWTDAQEAHDVRQVRDRADWNMNILNPYREENADD